MENFEKEYYWEFYLRDNPLTKDDTNDCVAEVKTGPKTLQSEDIAKEIKRRGSESEYETILSIVSQANGIIEENLMNGVSVMTDLCQFTPRITGAFPSSISSFNPAVNKLTLDTVLSKRMREALKKVKPISLGAKPDVAGINLVTDTATGLTDGSITANDDIRIEGSCIKIAGDESIVGIFFVSEDGKTTVKVSRRLTQNDPSCILARVPNLANGTYTLRIVTQFIRGNALLKEARIIEYKKQLTVGGGEERPGEL
ncbi:DUF4469 domain-containing protein [uncultured Parabacteroides sp.]|uniref:DUF4469 domain-containing protein n=1 Tax=uncultured Parabacteroides sp. TaxID=512312 RepID=UPI0025F41C46|nr:DUF4469 domain-containing protein [uncultured Parabacteroides sp.]